MFQKVNFTVFIFLEASYFAQAQTPGFGLTGGLNYATIGGNADVKARIGYHLGIFAETKFSTKLLLSPELIYSLQGGNLIESNGSSKRLNYSYLNFPIMLKFFPSKHFYVQAGPQVGIVVNAITKNATTRQSIILPPFRNDKTRQSVIGQLNSIDLGVNIGIGYKVSNRLYTGLRYNLGLTNIGSFPTTEANSQSNRVLQLSTGILLF